MMLDLFDPSCLNAFLGNVLENILANLVSSIVLFIGGFLAGKWWDYSVKGRAFRRVFGKQAGKAGNDLLVVLDTIRDTRILSQADQQKVGIQNPPPSPTSARFFKTYPDGHFTCIPGPTDALIPDCSAGGAAYLLDAFRGVRCISTRTVSDNWASSRWNGTFISLGSSYSNIKTDDIKHLPENPWLANDAGEFTLKDGTIIKMEQRYDRGLIMKLANPHAQGHSVIVCEGLGEWGTSGSAWYLATHWRTLSRRFGNRPFAIVVRVTIGTDESAREILARGEECLLWRSWRWFKNKLSGAERQNAF